MKKFLVFIPVILIIAALLLGGCSTTPTTTSATPAATTVKTTTPAPTTVTPKTGGILKYGESLWYGSTLGWPGDPGWLVTPPAFNVFFDTILAIDNKAGVHPALATAWSVATDLKSITLTLRQGVKFHDGSDWNATVCKWNLDLLVTGKYGDYAYVTSVDIVDPNTVKLNLNQYSNSLLTTIGSTYGRFTESLYRPRRQQGRRDLDASERRGHRALQVRQRDPQGVQSRVPGLTDTGAANRTWTASSCSTSATR